MRMISRASARFFCIGIVSGQRFEHVRRHAPKPFRQWLHDPANVAVALTQDVDKRLAVESERHRAPHLRIVGGQASRLTIRSRLIPPVVTSQDRARLLVLDVFNKGSDVAIQSSLPTGEGFACLKPELLGPLGYKEISMFAVRANGPSAHEISRQSRSPTLTRVTPRRRLQHSRHHPKAVSRQAWSDRDRYL